MANSGSGAGKYKVSPGPFLVPKSREVLKEWWGHLKGCRSQPAWRSFLWPDLGQFEHQKWVQSIIKVELIKKPQVCSTVQRKTEKNRFATIKSDRSNSLFWKLAKRRRHLPFLFKRKCNSSPIGKEKVLFIEVCLQRNEEEKKT